MLRAILFDFDGTLADTEPIHYEAFRRVFASRGLTLDPNRYYERYLVGTDRECLARMIDDFSRPELRDVLDSIYHEKVAVMEELLAGEVRLFDGVEMVLARAAEMGPLAIVTGAVGSQVEAILRRRGIAGFFPVVIAAEDVSRGKPDPQGYRLGWQRLREQGLYDLEPAECLAVEDSPTGIAAARAAGMRTLAVTHSRPADAFPDADRVIGGYGEILGADLARLLD